MKTKFQTHDLSLSAWGPYTKKYSGISHIPAANDGIRFDLSVFPGLYRRRVDVPDVRFESGYHVWKSNENADVYTLRHELEWKDRVYADISFAPLSETVRLIRAECVNNTQIHQNQVLHFMASAYDPMPPYRNFAITGCDIQLPESAAFLLAKDYDDLRFANPGPMDNLGWDGLRRAEDAQEGFAAGYCIGQGFGCAKGRFGKSGRGDRFTFTMKLNASVENACLGIRYINIDAEAGVYEVKGYGRVVLAPSEKPRMEFIKLDKQLCEGEHVFEMISEGTGSAKLDCFVLCEADEADKVAITPRGSGCRPEIIRYENEPFITLAYPHIKEVYGVMWDYDLAEIREIENDELDIFLRDTVHNHVSSVLKGNGKGHFTNIFMRPIPLAPGERKVIYGAVLNAKSHEAAAAMCREVSGRKNEFGCVWDAAAETLKPLDALEEGGKFTFGQQLMQAVLLTNVVYPVYTRGNYIRHNTPGRWWDCLYTWDSGFVGMGLMQFSLRRAFDCLNAYLTQPGDDEAAFIFHGSMVPTQFYLFSELWNKTGSMELAEYCYPRLMQYYRFISGQAGSSTTANMKSGLLRPWDYFYNSGGWDDYPPQKTIHEKRLEAVCTPVITTAHVIRCAKILAHAAKCLSKHEDAKQLLDDANRLTGALDRYSWDEESGYFGYVLHDENGEPKEILRHESGENHNKGLGGASPLFAGACNEKQADAIWKKLETDGILMSDCGLSTVDRTAAYYRKDGYWNGAVWLPYQWMFFKAALDAGKADFAFRLSDTMLKLWEGECEASYHCFEHFMIESRRGAGWHQFGGLSSPVTQFYASYYRPGTLTTGFDTFVEKAEWQEGFGALDAVLAVTKPGRATVIAVTSTDAKKAEIDVPGASVANRYKGLWEITFETEKAQSVKLSIR